MRIMLLACTLASMLVGCVGPFVPGKSINRNFCRTTVTGKNCLLRYPVKYFTMRISIRMIYGGSYGQIV